MFEFIVKRLLHSILVLWGISIFAFSLIHLIPGDPVREMLGIRATTAQIAQIQHQLGLDKPLIVQYWDFLTQAVRGNLGISLKTGQPVLTVIGERFGATLELAAGGLAFAIIFGILSGVLAASRKGGVLDTVITTISILGISIPSFWLGMMLILLFSVRLGWLPVAGGTGLVDLIMPAVTLGFVTSTVISRLTRSGMIDILSGDYIRAARAKGLSEFVVMFKHALRNALVPIVTILGLQLAGLLGGAIIIEQVFNWPGMGTLAITALLSRDFPMIQGIILVLGCIFVIVNMIVDIAYSFIDPRIELGKEATE